MMQKKLLNAYNQQLIDSHQDQKNFSPGIFNNNHILFVSIDDAQECIKKIAGSCHHISSTTLIDNNIDILKKQINLLNPNIVIIFGKDIGKKLGLTIFYDIQSIQDVNYMLIPDVKTSYDNIDKIKNKINEFAKNNCITKVTNSHIYYRDVECNKKSYYNSVKSNYFFIQTEHKTEFKSFKGDYLKKIVKNKNNMTTASYEAHLQKKDIFYYENFKNVKHSKFNRVMMFDIETDFCNDVINTPKPIVSIAWADNMTNEYYILILKHSKEQQIHTNHKAKIKIFDDEKKMLSFFLSLMKKYDVITGWYSNGFDVPYVLNRAKVLDIDLQLYFPNIYIKLTDSKQFKIFQNEVCFYDAQEFYKKNAYYSKPKSYSLQDVAQYIFGKKAQKIKHEGVDTLWRKDINKLIKYNLRDVELLKMIIEEVNIINYPLKMQQLCPQDFDNVFYYSRTIENMLHQRYWNKKIYFPTKIAHQKQEFEGAIVFDPIAGLYKNVMVLDYSAMYTNVYLSHNYSPDTLIGEKSVVEEKFEEVKKDLIRRYPELKEKFKSKEETLEQWLLVKNDFGQFYFLPKNWKLGILPALEIEALNLRKYYKKLRDNETYGSMLYQIYDEQQGLAKQILNSIYGVVAYNKFILYNSIIPASITATARDLLEWSKQKGIEKEYTTLYGDTDSLFIQLNKTLNIEEAVKQAKEFEAFVNSTWKEFMSRYTKNQHMLDTVTHEIAFEKLFSKLLLTDKKKRYFGLLKFYKGKIAEKEEFTSTGVETRKDNTPQYFKTALKKAYLMLLEDNGKEKLRKMLSKMKIEIKSVDVDDLLIKTKLNKNIEDYINLPIHVRALKNANIEIRKGESVNMIYVDDAREVLHYDEDGKQEFKLDYDRYVQNCFIDKIDLINNNVYNFQTTSLEW